MRGSRELLLLRIGDLHHLDRLRPVGRAELDRVAFARLEQRAGDWRDPAHLALLQPRLVDAEDGDRALGIAWPAGIEPILAEKDIAGAPLASADCY